MRFSDTTRKIKEKFKKYQYNYPRQGGDLVYMHIIFPEPDMKTSNVFMVKTNTCEL